jgi:hypothetical protein
MSMTAVVVVTAMPPEAVLHVPVAVVMVVMTVPVTMREMMTMVTVIVVTVGMTMHGTVMTVAGAAVTTAAVTTTAVRARIGTGGDERRQADDGRSNESEKCGTFKHCRRLFGSMWAIQGIGRRRRAAGSSN